jgi:hypothetical protein
MNEKFKKYADIIIPNYGGGFVVDNKKNYLTPKIDTQSIDMGNFNY